MNKNIPVVGIIILFVLSACAPITFGSNVRTSILRNDGNTLYVGGNGPGNYTKIQDAIDNASKGDTVYVFNGTYHVKGSSGYGLVINKSINLIGEDRDKTIIDGNNCHTVVYLEMMTFVEYVSVNGFTIQNGSTGIYYDTGINNIDNPTYLQNQEHYSSAGFYNNILKNNKNGIIVGWMSENVGVYNNIITMNKKGIILYNCFMGNYVIHNTIENNEHGILVDGEGNGNTILENIIKSNKENGITLSYSYGATITRNTIFNNTKGIDISYSSGTDIEYNTIKNTKLGIYLLNSDSNYIRANVITENTDGIYLRESFRNDLQGNILENNEDGIVLIFSDNNTFQNNNFLNNKNGSFFWCSNSNTIKINNFLNNENCINITLSWSNTFKKNNFINNDKDVIFYIYFIHLLLNRNIWTQNYWNESRILPKPIFGDILIIKLLFIFQWFQFDWHPAKEPYDI